MSLDLLCMFNLLENCMYGQPAEKISSVRPGQFGYIVTTTVVHSITDISLSGFLTVIHRSAKRINSMRPLFGFDRLSISRFLYVRLNWNLTARCHETQCVLSSPILLRYGSPPRKPEQKESVKGTNKDERLCRSKEWKRYLYGAIAIKLGWGDRSWKRMLR